MVALPTVNSPVEASVTKKTHWPHGAAKYCSGHCSSPQKTADTSASLFLLNASFLCFCMTLSSRMVMLLLQLTVFRTSVCLSVAVCLYRMYRG